MKLLLLIVLMIFTDNLIAQDSAGGLFVEPIVTYERGRGEVNLPRPFGDAESELDGFGIGARLGVHVLGTIFVGADGRYSMPNFKEDKLGQDVEATSWNVGPVVGVQMPFIIGLRMWAGYILAGEVDPDESKGVDEKFNSGSGYRVGAGMKIFFVSLNLEYQRIKYDSTSFHEVGIFTTNTTRDDTELDNRATVLSVSFPLAI